MSQWSLTFEVRKRGQIQARPIRRHPSQWSLTFEVRKSIIMAPIIPHVKVSQWSLTFEVRKRAAKARSRTASRTVAMEPDL